MGATAGLDLTNTSGACSQRYEQVGGCWKECFAFCKGDRSMMSETNPGFNRLCSFRFPIVITLPIF